MKRSKVEYVYFVTKGTIDVFKVRVCVRECV